VLLVVWSSTSTSPVRLLDVGIATCYRLDGLDLNPGVGTRFSLPVETGPGAHLTSCVVGTGFLPGGKSARARPSWPVPSCNFVSMVSIASIPWAG